VSFTYEGALKPALSQVNIAIEGHTSIAFVGQTGSGKTTAVDIILGLLRPTQGHMSVDGIVVDSGNVRAWQRNIGYVPQSIFLSDDTIKANIAFGVPANDVDMHLVQKAAAVANVAEFIDSELHEKYEAVIGERGVRLSGGQRQRIGLARAMYRDPSVLILDEATSALDGITEDAVMDAIKGLSKRKTIVMIAHRLTTVKDCDIIYLMQGGQIIDQGSYDDLRSRSSWFRAAAKVVG